MTTGVKRLEWQMYIPSGKTAYYNIQESEVAGIAWNLELYFGDVTEGQGEFTVPAAGPTFTYPVDEWFLVEHIVDLDADNIKVYIDGVMVLDAAYTGSLGSVDCFSWSASNTYYLDDILYIEEEVVVAEPCDVPGAVFCDNMDTYEEGALGPNADWWSTWSGVEGGAEDGLVSSDFAASAPNSALIPEGGVTDVILKLGNLSSGKYNLYWNMYVPSGSHAYYNIQETEVPGVAWNAELYFGLATPGEGEITVPAELTFTYPPDAWFLIEHIIDMDANTIEIKLNGTVILSEIYEGNMGGVDFYSIDALNRYYLDDVALMPMDPTDLNTYYQDADSDTYGNADVSITVAGDAPTGYVENNLDCDDTNPDIYPGAIEVLNNKDDDCDELIDEGLINIETLAATGMAIQVYPVPANNNVTIELMSLMSGEAATFEIYNTTG
ncbi:MAG: putative metal-binding motif-containing protein [Bacteroidetes bacterium]|nr:putative metal-binding motif-containing protein [Bacteroidota bacterium]